MHDFINNLQKIVEIDPGPVGRTLDYRACMSSRGYVISYGVYIISLLKCSLIESLKSNTLFSRYCQLRSANPVSSYCMNKKSLIVWTINVTGFVKREPLNWSKARVFGIKLYRD